MSTVPVDRSREVVEKEWCEVTEQAPKINSNGVFRDRSGSTDTCDGCAPNCGDPEAPQPVGKTCTTLLSVSFTDTKERTTKGWLRVPGFSVRSVVDEDRLGDATVICFNCSFSPEGRREIGLMVFLVGLPPDCH